MTTLNKAMDTLTPLADASIKSNKKRKNSAKAFIDAGKDGTYFLCPTHAATGHLSTCTPEQWDNMKARQLLAYTKREQEIMALAAAKAKLTPEQRKVRDRINGEIRDNFKILRRAIDTELGKTAKAKAAKTGAKAPTAKVDGHTRVLERLTGTMKLAKEKLSENCYKEVQKLAALQQKLIIEDKKLDQ